MFLRKVYYHHLHDYIYSFVYYLKGVGDNLIELLSEFKNPKTWSTLLIFASIYAIITKNYSLFTWLIPMLVLVGMIRQKRTRSYKKELMKNALLKNNIIILEDEYEKYKRDCKFSKKCELGFEDWKAEELDKIQKNNK